MLIPVNDTWGAHFPPGTAERVVPALQTRRKAPGRDALAGRAAQAGQVRRRVTRRPSIRVVTWDWPGSSVGLTRGSGWCRQTRNCTEIDRSGTMYKIVRRVYKFELFFFAARRCACVVASPRAQRMSTASEARRHAQQRK